MSQLDVVVSQVKLLPPDDLVKLIHQVAKLLEQKQLTVQPHKVDYVALIGSGQGSFASPEESNRFIREVAGWRVRQAATDVGAVVADSCVAPFFESAAAATGEMPASSGVFSSVSK